MIVENIYFTYDETVKSDEIFSSPVPVRGIIAIRNLKTGKTYLEKTEDAVVSFQKERFNLDLSMHPSAELQNEYTALGLELFTIELDTQAENDENLDFLLEKRKEDYKKQGIMLYQKQ